MKKFLSALILGLMLPSAAMAGTFTDVSGGHDYFYAIEVMKAFDVVGGYADGTYGPDLTINRAEMIKIAALAAGHDPEAEGYTAGCFTDVAGHWAEPYACYAKDNGWVQGYEDGSYGVDRPVQRGEAIKMIAMAYDMSSALPAEGDLIDIYTDVATDSWQAPYVQMFYPLNVFRTLEGDFGITGELTRAEMADYMYRLMVVEYAGAPYSEGYANGFFTLYDLGYIYAMEFQDISSTPEPTTPDEWNGQGMEIDVFAYDETPEYVTLKNNGTDNADLTGWYLEMYTDFMIYNYSLPALTLAPGETLTVYSAAGHGTYSFGYGEDFWDDWDVEVRLYDDVDYLVYYYGDVEWD